MRVNHDNTERRQGRPGGDGSRLYATRRVEYRPQTERRSLDLGLAAGGRALWYELALFTGLRVSEIAALEWRDVLADGARPAIRLRAATTKAGRSDEIPLRRDLAERLLATKPANAAPTARVFRSTPTLKTFHRDCDRAGIAWRPDEHGRMVDRRSLRTSFITWLPKSGVTPQVAKELARHTDIHLTMNHYTDPRALDQHGAVESLPDVTRLSAAAGPATVKTRTDARAVVSTVVPPVVPNGRERGCMDMYDTGRRIRLSAVSDGKFKDKHVDAQTCKIGATILV